MKTARRAALVALLAALAAVLPALAADVPCATETASFCSDVTPGDRRLLSCLRSRWPDLSDSCRAALDRTRYKTQAFIGQCEAELFGFCANIAPTEDAVMACLGDHASELSTACRAAYDKVKNAASRYQAACGSEIGMFCSSVPGDDAAKLRVCLAGRASELSAACTAAIAP